VKHAALLLLALPLCIALLACAALFGACPVRLSIQFYEGREP